MARKPRLELEGGLYHVITRGNDRQDIFHGEEDFAKFLALLTAEKEKLGFFLYAYCLMTNHIHLLIERQAETVGRIMQRVLTGYSQWYNRRYGHVGHVFQGRHKAILCQSDLYLGELVRYIHLNPVRAKMVAKAEDYPYSSHRAYLGLEPAGIVDVDPVLRLFGHTKELATERFREYVLAGVDIHYPDGFDSPAEGRVLGSKEFVDDAIHRIGDTPARRPRKTATPFNPDALVVAVEAVFGIPAGDFLGPDKNARSVMAKGVFVLLALEFGASGTEISSIIIVDQSNVTRRSDAARTNLASNSKLRFAKEMVEKKYQEMIAESHV